MLRSQPFFHFKKLKHKRNTSILCNWCSGVQWIL